MAGNLIKPTSHLEVVDTFEFTTTTNQVDYTLNLQNASHLSLSLQFIHSFGPQNYFQLTFGYNNFHPKRISVKVKSTNGLHIRLGEIIPPETNKKFGISDVVQGSLFNLVIEVTYPDLDPPFKKSSATFAMDYEAKFKTLEELSDFSVICKEKIFPCHKVVLAARSECFAGLIKDMKKDKVDIKDFAPSVVENMITFMYQDKLPQELSIEDTEELFKIADKYHIDSLRQTCENILVKDLDINYALRGLHFAKKYEAEKLLEKSLKIVKDNLGMLVCSKEFGILMSDFPYIFEEKMCERETKTEK